MTFAEKLHQRTLEVAKHFIERETELITCLTELWETKALFELKYTSIWAYCIEALDFGNSRAGYLSSVTMKAAVIPELKEALVQGELSANKANMILSVLDPREDPKPWIEKAKNLTQQKLELAVKSEKPEATPRETFRRISKERFTLTLSVTNEERELILRAKELVAQKTKSVANFETTLVQLAKEFVDRHDPLKKAQRRRHSGNGVKTTKGVSAQTKHEVAERDGARCTYVSGDGRRCDARQWLDTHHIKHRAHGGTHELDNLTTLCWHHHRLLHDQPQGELKRRNLSRHVHATI